MSVTEATTEQRLRAHFHSVPAKGSVDPWALVVNGHRQLRTRRRRRLAAAITPVVMAATATGGWAHSRPHEELTGVGLTLTSGTPGVVQVSDDRVDLGDGIQAWRLGSTLSIGYPQRPYAFLDTSALSSQWGHLGYDTVVLDDIEPPGPTTTVVGTVDGTPDSVTVTIGGITGAATIACFTQAHGWCSYKVVLPVSTADDTADAPEVHVS